MQLIDILDSMGLIGGMYGVASVLGPILGGMPLSLIIYSMLIM